MHAVQYVVHERMAPNVIPIVFNDCTMKSEYRMNIFGITSVGNLPSCPLLTVMAFLNSLHGLQSRQTDLSAGEQGLRTRVGIVERRNEPDGSPSNCVRHDRPHGFGHCTVRFPDVLQLRYGDGTVGPRNKQAKRRFSADVSFRLANHPLVWPLSCTRSAIDTRKRGQDRADAQG